MNFGEFCVILKYTIRILMTRYLHIKTIHGK